MAMTYDRGLVLTLYPEQLRRFGATCTVADDEAVTAEHDFLCLSTDAREGLWTPLHVTRGQQRLPIMEGAKSGQARWTQGISWYSTADLWRIPHKAIQRSAPLGGERPSGRVANRVAAAAVPELAQFAGADGRGAGSA